MCTAAPPRWHGHSTVAPTLQKLRELREISTLGDPVLNSWCSKIGRTMYCPQCKAEYRQGFTRCADCDIDLVHEPPASASGSGEAAGQAENPDDPFCSFWRGDDPRIHAELCELLNEESIPHRTVRREDHLFNLNTKSGFEIGIPFSQFDKAEAAVKNAYGTVGEGEDATQLLPFRENYSWSHERVIPWKPVAKGYARALFARGDEPQNDEVSVTEEHDAQVESERTRAGWDPADWNPEDATLMVWSSEQSYPGEIIEMALRENQIHARFEKADGSNAIFVLPECATRAREIVKEIVEGEPPE